jgi:hypothetical protein
LEDYVELLVATGAAIRTGASLPDPSVPLLEGIGIRSEHWVEAVRSYRDRFFAMVGHRVDGDRAKGSAWPRKIFRSAA